MPSKVYFTDLHANSSLNLLKKLENLVKKAGIDTLDFDNKIAASFDPVALDQACADMVKEAPTLPRSRIGNGGSPESHIGMDKFTMTHPNTHWDSGLEHAEMIGLGTRKYEVITVS